MPPPTPTDIISPAEFQDLSLGTISSSGSSTVEIRRAPSRRRSRFQNVDTGKPRRIRFQKQPGKAELVALSPDCKHAAFVFKNDIQVCNLALASNTERKEECLSRVILTAVKKRGNFVAAALSNTHLVAISEKDVSFPLYEVVIAISLSFAYLLFA